MRYIKAWLGCWLLNALNVEPQWRKGGWLPIDVGDSIHVIPLDDEVDHVCIEGCVCGPSVEPEHENVRPIVTHHSLDGRERAEGAPLAR